jgi:hypothetical protein
MHKRQRVTLLARARVVESTPQRVHTTAAQQQPQPCNTITGSWALGVGPEGAVLYGAAVQREDRRVKYGEALSWCCRLVALGLGLSMHLPHKSPMQAAKF